jgi:hypothetical protein
MTNAAAMSRRILAGLAIALIGVVGVLLIANRAARLPEPRPIPVPNGYDEFILASRMLGEKPAPVGKETPEQIAAYVASNRLALERLRIGLSRSSLAPAYASSNAQTHLDTLSGMKALARLIAGEADLARQAKDWDRLVTASTQGIDFGVRLAQGGVLMDSLMATAAEAMARAPLEKALPELPAAPARKAALALVQLDPTRETFKGVMLYEELYVRRNSPMAMRVAWNLFLRRRTQAAFDKAEVKYNTSLLATRTLTVQLAARAYTLERGQAPSSPDALVPEYLPLIPVDPTTGKPLTRISPTSAAAATQAPTE